VNEPGPASESPRIRIIQGKDSVAIEQHRPSVLSSLAGLPVDRALGLIPNLLPICGLAQSVAASRAVAAARGEAPDDAREANREHRLWREQALSAAWRLAVDWPDLLGKPRAMVWLKALRHSASNTDCADVLESALPGLDAVWSVDDLARWADSEDNHAAGIVRESLEHARPVRTAGKRLTGAALADTARASLESEHFNPLSPNQEAVEVGPLAMERDPLIARHADQLTATTAGRLQALVLDTRQIIRSLRDETETPVEKDQVWQECAGTGTGRATTARGPVFHRVELDGRDRVLQWRAVAPTDWHFASTGPVARVLGESAADQAARLAIAGFDPCAPWTLEQGVET
jgi:coenzyme F420-reducing hydrogenase alpha subunit